MPDHRSDFPSEKVLTRALGFARRGDFAEASSRSASSLVPPKAGRSARAQAVVGRRSRPTDVGVSEVSSPPCPLRLASVLMHRVFLAFIGFFVLHVLLCRLALAESIPVVIPEQLGSIENVHLPKSTQKPTLILIQDAHSEYGAQKSLAEILKYLVLSYDLRLVLVEGGDGNVDLSYLRQGVPAKRLEDVAERYLKSGKISGEEYLDLTLQGAELDLWGIEDEDLYSRNMEAYLRFHENQERALSLVKKIKENLRELKIKYYPAEIYELETFKERAETHEGSAAEYFQALNQGLVSRPALSLKAYPAFNQWLKLEKDQGKIDTTKADLEKTQLVRILSQLATKEEMFAYREASQREGVEAEIESLRTLLELKKSYEHQLSRYSAAHLTERLRSLQMFKALNATDLFLQADALYRKIRGQDLPRGDARKVAELADDLELVEKLLKLEWAPADERKYASLGRGWDLKRATSWFGDPKSLYELQKRILEAQRFYEIARAREHAIFRNVVGKMNQPSRKIYVLIVGGYHAPDLAKMFMDQGIPVITVTPRFTPSNEPNNYFRVLREKWGKGHSSPSS